MSIHNDENKTGIEIIIGLVGRLGVDLDNIICNLKDQAARYNSQVEIIKISDLMQLIGKNKIINNDINNLIENLRLENKLMSKMDLGNKFRENFQTNAILAMMAVKKIKHLRQKILKDRNKMEKPHKNIIYVIRQLKREEEIDLLSEIYGNSFLQLSIYTSDDKAKYNLEQTANNEIDDIPKLIKRDWNENLPYGQKIQDCFHRAHYFLSETSTISIANQIKRMLDLLFCVTFNQPTYDEYFMSFANLASLRSMTLSRQVGSVIVNKHNELVSVGFNELQIEGRAISIENGDDIFFENNRPVEFNSYKKHKIIHSILEDLDARSLAPPKV